LEQSIVHKRFGVVSQDVLENVVNEINNLITE